MSTKEEAFFGVKNDVTMPAPEIDDDVEIEFVDDTPEKDKPYVKPSAEIIEQENKKSLQEETTDDDEETEISKVSKNVNKRIKQLTKQYHEERRSKESAQRISDEALRATEKLMNENKRLSELVRKSQEAMEAEAKLRADADIKLAEDQFKIALDSADNAAIVEAQKRLTDAQMLKLSKPSVFDTPEEQWAPQEQEPQQQQVDFSNITPDPKAVEWQKENPWFGEDEEMTSFAYGVHDKITREGVDPESSEYYKLIDSRMRQVFPDKFDNDDTEVVEVADRQKENPVVAPARRGTGGGSRKVTMTQTQLRIAKRLGLTPQQYAAQLLKENS
jgi:hypothetical protein